MNLPVLNLDCILYICSFDRCLLSIVSQLNKACYHETLKLINNNNWNIIANCDCFSLIRTKNKTWMWSPRINTDLIIEAGNYCMLKQYLKWCISVMGQSIIHIILDARNKAIASNMIRECIDNSQWEIIFKMSSNSHIQQKIMNFRNCISVD